MFGNERPVNTTYLRALEVKLAGGNQVQVARASLQASMRGKELDEAQLANSIAAAAERILRLYRLGGNDSQALDYIEQELLAQALRGIDDDRARVIASVGASFSFVDSAALHRVGLFDMPETAIHKPAEEVVQKYLELYAS